MKCIVHPGRISMSVLSPVQLSKFYCLLNKDCDAALISLNKQYGVYFIVDNKNKKVFNKKGFLPNKNIIYIGKARGETIFSRNRKHVKAIKPSLRTIDIRPGVRFKKYAASIKHDSSKLWVIPAIMDIQSPYLISCAEEYFICQYENKFGELPKANSAGSCLKVQK